MSNIDRLLRKLERLEIGITAFKGGKLVVYDVPNGSVICIDGPNVPWQKVQWIAASDSFDCVEGYIN